MMKLGCSRLNQRIYSSVYYRVKFDSQKSKQTSFLLRIHHLRLAFCKVWKVRLVINIMLIILKSLFDIVSCSTRVFSRINTLK